MRRGFGILTLIVVIVAGVIVGTTAYRAGEDHGFDRGLEQVREIQASADSGGTVEVVRVVDDGRPWGIFPFGFLLFPLFFFGFLFLVKGLFWRRGGRGPGGPWEHHGPGDRASFEERARSWHHEEHEGGGTERQATA